MPNLKKRITRAKPSKLKDVTNTVWEKITYNWSWFDSIISAVLVGLLGYMIGRMNFFDLSLAESMQMMNVQMVFILKAFLAAFFWARMWSSAQKPKYKDYTWGQLSVGQMLVTLAKEHYVSIIAGVIALAFTASIAPEILELASWACEVP